MFKGSVDVVTDYAEILLSTAIIGGIKTEKGESREGHVNYFEKEEPMPDPATAPQSKKWIFTTLFSMSRTLSGILPQLLARQTLRSIKPILFKL